jgi:D-lactate dehydrogenase
MEEQMWELLDRRGAEYPAEHNVGHLYHAKPALVSHYKELDPCNAFNPGIGRTTKCTHWLAADDTSDSRKFRCVA